jgi:CRISPR-associated endonuclease/helicase Cas3
MLVTFISECEKKALSRTRRVLDAFANRIGNNTWQTPITEEGLNAVKRLLQKTASKNTAVSCHQLKSRIRTELLWVVGRREKFNNEGIVAVNYTEADKFIGEINMGEIYANTKKQSLDQHLFAVGVVAKELMKTFCTDENLQKAALSAGFWHDIGKLEVHFQNWINKELEKKNLITELPENGVHIEKGRFSWEKYPTHNEVSTLIYELLADDSSLGKIEKKAVKHTIYWHHAKPIRKDDIFYIHSRVKPSLNQVLEKLKDNDLKKLLIQSKEVMESVGNLMGRYFDKNQIKTKSVSDYEDEIDGVKLPEYKTYETSGKLESYKRNIKKNAKENLIRITVITADRMVSSLSCEDLQNYIDNRKLESFAKDSLTQEQELNQHIKVCLEGFEVKYPNSDRNKQQTQAAEELANEEIDIAVLKGPAGCGKTKIALEWALKTSAKQIIWVCPRVAICQSLFNDLSSKEYLPNATIEIHTGEFKYTNKNPDPSENEYFSGDIVLTTIDQIISGITTHRNISNLARFMNATVVFDEFHEYIPMNGFNILFAELIECKKLQQNDETLPSALLVSATPNYYFVKEFLDIAPEDIVGIESFNEKFYEIEFIDYDEIAKDETNALYQKVDKNTFVISNTAITAQKSFINSQADENSILTHSKFTLKDRESIFSSVFDSFSENGTHKFDVLRSGPVIQAALNISCQNMISEMDIAENILQRLGRLNRFAEYDMATLKIAITEGIKNGKQKGKAAKFLGRSHQLQSTKVWYGFLSNKLENSKNITIDDLYTWYQAFYEDETCLNMIEQDFIASLKKSVGVIHENIFEPKRIKLSKNSTIKLKKHSLRGNSRFVQMAIYEVSKGESLDEYLTESMTLGVNEIKNENDGEDDSALEFMAKKHHNIKKENNKMYGVTKKTPNKKELYLKNSRDPEMPIYVSYTPSDLDTVKATASSEAIYYLKGINQAIGVMSISKLQDNE